MPKYRSKPVVIEAMRLSQANREEVLKFLGESNYDATRTWDPVNIMVLNEHGPVLAEVGDWVIKGSRGEFYPCKDSTFRQKYEEVK